MSFNATIKLKLQKSIQICTKQRQIYTNIQSISYIKYLTQLCLKGKQVF